VVFKCGCGDCPGLVVPRVDLQMTVLDSLGVSVDEIYFGTCVKKATSLMNCPMNVEGVTEVMEKKFGVPVHMGTHDY
jgi:predicted metal-binding protein